MHSRGYGRNTRKSGAIKVGARGVNRQWRGREVVHFGEIGCKGPDGKTKTEEEE